MKRAAVVLVLTGCTYGASFDDCEVSCTDAIGCPDGFSCSTELVCRPPDATGLCFSELGLFPVIVSQDIDVLFVVDNTTTVDAAGVFASIYQGPWSGTSGLPNVHIGVTSTDLGMRNVEQQTQLDTDGCVGSGDDGALRTNAAVTNAFISDISTGMGGRQTNYTGTITSVFNALADVGANGCMFQQPLAAVPLAVATASFVRPAASLAVVIVSDGDDCSLETDALFGGDNEMLGAATPFRCTRFGVTCDDNGTSPDTMNLAGPKAGCHSSASTDYLAAVSPFVAALSALKADPRSILVGAVTGPSTPVAVDQSAGASELTPSCTSPTATAIPAIRTSEYASSFRRSMFASACDTGALAHFADPIAELTGSACLRAPIADAARCVVTDETLTTSNAVPPCDATHTTDCYNLIDQASCAEGGKALQVLRTNVPDPTTMTSVRCRN